MKPSEITKPTQLGEALFNDKSLSRDFTISCASCHRAEFAFADSLAISAGIRGRRGLRNAPSLLNLGSRESFMWDGGVNSLLVQPQVPIDDTAEMHFSIPQAIYRLRLLPQYKQAFKSIFNEEINEKNFQEALTTYMLTLTDTNRYQQWIISKDSSLFSANEWAGWKVFSGKGNCTQCHNGYNMSDGNFYKLFDSDPARLDVGRFRVTQNPVDSFAFRTPELKSLTKTAPYFHDGRAAMLAEVIDFFDAGGCNCTTALQTLRLTEREKSELLSFLKTL